jgi:hypothetical protein
MRFFSCRSSTCRFATLGGFVSGLEVVFESGACMALRYDDGVRLDWVICIWAEYWDCDGVTLPVIASGVLVQNSVRRLAGRNARPPGGKREKEKNKNYKKKTYFFWREIGGIRQDHVRNDRAFACRLSNLHYLPSNFAVFMSDLRPYLAIVMPYIFRFQSTAWTGIFMGAGRGILHMLHNRQ